MELKEFRRITARLRCESGLHIGGRSEGFSVGDLDGPIARDPMTGQPYIPGSSLKGKLRSLLEMKYSAHTKETGRPCNCAQYDTCDVCRLFGCGEAVRSSQPTRLLFRDCRLTADSAAALARGADELYRQAEVKSEIRVDRSAGKTAHGGLRQIERVPAGTEFDVEIVLRIYEGDDPEKHVAKVKECFELLQQDYLGGGGSRGYGKVRIYDLAVDGRPV
ncbi:MAG: type III-A CRISPR-associated RAMP protein Csm3 [Planctomycetota bacterium]|nr:type III-A CRISPR-associated RAMP protein Csm3 [Planctomycetota bacterium]